MISVWVGKLLVSLSDVGSRWRADSRHYCLNNDYGFGVQLLGGGSLNGEVLGEGEQYGEVGWKNPNGFWAGGGPAGDSVGSLDR